MFINGQLNFSHPGYTAGECRGKQSHLESTLPAGPWQGLLMQAFTILDDMQVHSGVADPFWTFGGGTVLMLRFGHRRSKDIDIFVPDPLYLGFVTPRLSDVAAAVSSDYVEAAGYVKLICKEGEIDFVAAPNLTSEAFETWTLFGRPTKIETASEIVAKKLWHRGEMAIDTMAFKPSFEEAYAIAERFLKRL